MSGIKHYFPASNVYWSAFLRLLYVLQTNMLFFLMLYSKFLLVIYFIHNANSVYVCVCVCVCVCVYMR